MLSLLPEESAPFPAAPPVCLRCDTAKHVLCHVTGSDNPNSNVGRPFYKCHSCPRFLVFADVRGNDPANRLCHCKVSSKRQVSGPAKGYQVHYVCRLGACDYYDIHRRGDGAPFHVDPPILAVLVELGVV